VLFVTVEPIHPTAAQARCYCSLLPGVVMMSSARLGGQQAQVMSAGATAGIYAAGRIVGVPGRAS
jgi:hypothetical protein